MSYRATARILRPDLDVRLAYRPGTMDEAVLEEIFVGDEYQLRHDQIREIIHGGIVIDAGANIGAFSAACLAYGARLVVAIEPEPENFRLLEENLAPWYDQERVVLCSYAVGNPEEYPEVGLTGGTGPEIRVDRAAASTIPVSSLEATIRSGLMGVLAGQPVAMLKIDVEGSEYDWLLPAPDSALRRINRIAMEWHAHAPGGYSVSLYEQLCGKLAWTHSISAFGRPDLGGMLYAHPYKEPGT